jgi:prefoldin subunit 5
MEEAAVNRLASSITRLTLCQVTTDEIDAATKLLDKACQKLRGIPDVPTQRITDFEATIRQLRHVN